MTKMLKHQKKRNVGLLNEFFARYIAKAIIEHRDTDIQLAKSIFCKHFNKSTDLYKELKYFNALYQTKVRNKESAVSLINEIKTHCRRQSQQKLDLEKTALLHEINSILKDQDFFNRPVVEYKEYATIQVLLNHWRSPNLKENIGEASVLEDKLLESLLTNGESKPSTPDLVVENALGMTNKDIDQLVVSIMFDKLNKKFGNQLSVEQKEVVNLYVFSNENDTAKSKLKESLNGVKTRTLKLIDLETNKVSLSSLNEGSVYTNDKLTAVKNLILEVYRNTEVLTDESISFYLALFKLEQELLNKESTNASA